MEFWHCAGPDGRVVRQRVPRQCRDKNPNLMVALHESAVAALLARVRFAVRSSRPCTIAARDAPASGANSNPNENRPLVGTCP